MSSETMHDVDTRLDIAVTLLFFAIYLFCQSPSSSAYGRRLMSPIATYVGFALRKDDAAWTVDVNN